MVVDRYGMLALPAVEDDHFRPIQRAQLDVLVCSSVQIIENRRGRLPDGKHWAGKLSDLHEPWSDGVCSASLAYQGSVLTQALQKSAGSAGCQPCPAGELRKGQCGFVRGKAVEDREGSIQDAGTSARPVL